MFQNFKHQDACITTQYRSEFTKTRYFRRKKFFFFLGIGPKVPSLHSTPRPNQAFLIPPEFQPGFPPTLE